MLPNIVKYIMIYLCFSWRAVHLLHDVQNSATDDDHNCSRIVDILFYDLRLLSPSVSVSCLSFFLFFMFPSWRNIRWRHEPLITKFCCGKFSAREREEEVK